VLTDLYVPQLAPTPEVLAQELAWDHYGERAVAVRTGGRPGGPGMFRAYLPAGPRRLKAAGIPYYVGLTEGD